MPAKKPDNSNECSEGRYRGLRKASLLCREDLDDLKLRTKEEEKGTFPHKHSTTELRGRFSCCQSRQPRRTVIYELEEAGKVFDFILIGHILLEFHFNQNHFPKTI